MKVLIVNTSDIDDGSARAAYRLHRAILAEGTDSKMLVQGTEAGDFTVIAPTTKIEKVWGRILRTLDSLPVRHYSDRTKTMFSSAWVPFSGLVDRINSLQPDVVHLHWVAGGMLRVGDIRRIKAPIVWSLHDMWPFTGGCHYDENCGAFRQQCGNCRVLRSPRSNDLSRRTYQRKHNAFQQKKDITLVGVSQWLAGEAMASSLFSAEQVVCLPNPIDTQVFAPFDQLAARDLLNLPQDKKLILFGAVGATSDPRKGYTQLCQALQQLQTQDAELVVFGAGRPEKGAEFPQSAHFLGRLHDDVALRVLYSASDVMVVPSLQEAFGQTASEAMACGTPVVAFGATGLLDIVDHKENGYLAKPFDVKDLAAGIDWILEHDSAESLAVSAVNKIRQSFDYKVVAPKYIELYQSVLEKGQ